MEQVSTKLKKRSILNHIQIWYSKKSLTIPPAEYSHWRSRAKWFWHELRSSGTQYLPACSADIPRSRQTNSTGTPSWETIWKFHSSIQPPPICRSYSESFWPFVWLWWKQISFKYLVFWSRHRQKNGQRVVRQKKDDQSSRRRQEECGICQCHKCIARWNYWKHEHAQNGWQKRRNKVILKKRNVS